mmetsp:Transcript_12044/g.26811  ORF Transcript_12044/g.26811 Transcript_12044/m.26811 type:complete len:544 (-) Transcript_12044:132-1763(-)
MTRPAAGPRSPMLESRKLAFGSSVPGRISRGSPPAVSPSLKASCKTSPAEADRRRSGTSRASTATPPNRIRDTPESSTSGPSPDSKKFFSPACSTTNFIKHRSIPHEENRSPTFQSPQQQDQLDDLKQRMAETDHMVASLRRRLGMADTPVLAAAARSPSIPVTPLIRRFECSPKPLIIEDTKPQQIASESSPVLAASPQLSQPGSPFADSSSVIEQPDEEHQDPDQPEEPAPLASPRGGTPPAPPRPIASVPMHHMDPSPARPGCYLNRTEWQHEALSPSGAYVASPSPEPCSHDDVPDDAGSPVRLMDEESRSVHDVSVAHQGTGITTLMDSLASPTNPHTPGIRERVSPSTIHTDKTTIHVLPSSSTVSGSCGPSADAVRSPSSIFQGAERCCFACRQPLPGKGSPRRSTSEQPVRGRSGFDESNTEVVMALGKVCEDMKLSFELAHAAMQSMVAIQNRVACRVAVETKLAERDAAIEQDAMSPSRRALNSCRGSAKWSPSASSIGGSEMSEADQTNHMLMLVQAQLQNLASAIRDRGLQ